MLPACASLRNEPIGRINSATSLVWGVDFERQYPESERMLKWYINHFESTGVNRYRVHIVILGYSRN